MTEGSRRIVEAIRAIPKGKVACYRDIARAAGIPNGARQVVRILHALADKEKLPWYRIIRADGFIALPRAEGGLLQARLLRAEGVRVSGFAESAPPKKAKSAAGRDFWVDLEKFGFFSEQPGKSR
jgi:methylated-DNA-protein-cysteine methyltransferase-like protein